METELEKKLKSNYECTRTSSSLILTLRGTIGLFCCFVLWGVEPSIVLNPLKYHYSRFGMASIFLDTFLNFTSSFELKSFLCSLVDLIGTLEVLQHCSWNEPEDTAS